MKKKILFILAFLFGLLFINAGLDKFFHYMPVPEDMPEETVKVFEAIMQIVWLLPLIAIAEIVGGLLVIIPKTRALGALIILPVMVGILLVNIFGEISGLVIGLPLAAILSWILYDNRHKYRPLIV